MIEENNSKEWYSNYLTRVPEINSLATKELLWNQLCTYIKDIEIDAIRRQIGEPIISENEELHNELKSLIEILFDYRGETQQQERQVEWARMSFKGDTIFKQVKLNIQSLTEMLKKQHDKIFESERDKEIVSFVLNNSNPPSRPETPRPSSRQSSNSSDGSESSTFSGGLEMKEVEKHLNFLSVHEVLSNIREAIHFEKDILNEDIEYIRELIDEEFSFNKSLSHFKVPSLSEVKQVENKLQENLRIVSLASREAEKKKELKPLSKPSELATRPKTPSFITNNLKKTSSSTVTRLRNAIRQSKDLSIE